MRWLRHGFGAGSLLALFACVPATDDLSPSGAAGFVLEPSPATRGEPFTTADGYRVTFERVVLHGSVSVGPPAADEYDSDFRTGYESVVFSAVSREPIWAGGASVGAAAVDMSASFAYLDDPGETDELIIQGDVADVMPRFLRVPDLSTASEYDDISEIGPSLLLVLRAEGLGRSYRMDLTLEASFLSSNDFGGVAVEVEANALRTVPLPVRAECLLRGSTLTIDESGAGSRPAAEFGVFARADADGDGVISASELDAASSSSSYSEQSLASDLISRTACLLLSEEEDDERFGL